jgi:hypothetical protein
MSVFHNYPIVAAFTAILLAQFIKVPLNYTTNQTWDWGLVFSAGGMPSSHTAAVIALTTAIGIMDGLHSSAFAISVVVSSIIMFDAAGVRRQAGEHAVILNRLIQQQKDTFRSSINNGEALKELLGHRPLEVIWGGFVGVGVGVLMDFFF